MTYHVPEKLNADLAKPAIVHSTDQPWTPSQTSGVDRRFLERDGAEVARASTIVRYAPGSAFPAHVHDKGEEYLVLSGVFSDGDGDFRAGSYVRNPPGSKHAPYTHGGCTIFVKLRQFRDDDQVTVHQHIDEVDFERTPVTGVSRATLFTNAHETVTIEIVKPGAVWTDRQTIGGEEIFVIEGQLHYGGHECGPGAWLRVPSGAAPVISSPTGCRLWVKRGHLHKKGASK